MKNNQQTNPLHTIERRCVGTLFSIGEEEGEFGTFEWGYVYDRLGERASRYGRFHNLLTPQTVSINAYGISQYAGLLNDLKLQYCGFTELPSAIGLFNRLERLEIRSCDSLAELPESIGRLESLVVLTIFDCYIFERFPSSIERLKRLKTLEITCCPQLSALPPSIGEVNNLEQLHIHSTSIQSLPNEVGKLNKLCGLFLSDCDLLTVLPDSIGKLKQLKWLDIQGCNQVATIPKSIGKLKTLLHMRLGCSSVESLSPNLELLDITESATLSSLVELSNLSKLKTLSIIGSDSSIFNAILGISNLTHLSLQVPPDIVNSFPFLPKLESLTIRIPSNSGDGVVPDAVVIKIFDLGVWREGTSLKELCIHGNDIQGDFGNILRGGLLPRSLRKLALSKCKIHRFFDDTCLPQGLLELRLQNCSRSSYSDLQRVEYIRNLATKYERLWNIVIHDEINKTGRCGAFLPDFPIKEAFLMKFNQCGRILVRHNESTKVKPLPVSLWPAVFDRVNDVVERRESTWKRRHDHDKEIEASIVFQLLQGPAFLSRGCVDDSRNSTIVSSLQRKQEEICRKMECLCIVM